MGDALDSFLLPRIWRAATPAEELVHTGTNRQGASAAEVHGLATQLGLTHFSLVMFLRAQGPFTGVIQTIINYVPLW